MKFLIFDDSFSTICGKLRTQKIFPASQNRNKRLSFALASLPC
jgi:hypothetical protein